jgi:hypothetical protein
VNVIEKFRSQIPIRERPEVDFVKNNRVRVPEEPKTRDETEYCENEDEDGVGPIQTIVRGSAAIDLKSERHSVEVPSKFRYLS